MNVIRFNLPRDRLDAAPEEERTLFLLLGHFSNQVSLLGKWTAWCKADEAVSDIERKGQVAQAMMVLSLLAAKLNEGWELLQKQYFGSQISRHYARLIDAEGLDALKQLGRYFSADNAIRTCRHEYAFHYD